VMHSVLYKPIVDSMSALSSAYPANDLAFRCLAG
jgi:hypothetical protein